jgi:hypothetical protein
MTVLPRVGHERLYGSAWSPDGIGEYSLSELSPPAPPAVAIIALVLTAPSSTRERHERRLWNSVTCDAALQRTIAFLLFIPNAYPF